MYYNCRLNCKLFGGMATKKEVHFKTANWFENFANASVLRYDSENPSIAETVRKPQAQRKEVRTKVEGDAVRAYC